MRGRQPDEAGPCVATDADAADPIAGPQRGRPELATAGPSAAGRPDLAPTAPTHADPRCSPGYGPDSYPLASVGRNVVWRGSLVLTTSIIERE